MLKISNANDLELVSIFEDPALSGSLPPLERPGLHALLETLKAGEVMQIFVTRLDKFARDTMLSLWLMNEVKKPEGQNWSASWTGPANNQVEDKRDEIIKLLKIIDKNIKEINAELK